MPTQDEKHNKKLHSKQVSKINLNQNINLDDYLTETCLSPKKIEQLLKNIKGKISECKLNLPLEYLIQLLSLRRTKTKSSTSNPKEIEVSPCKLKKIYDSLKEKQENTRKKITFWLISSFILTQSISGILTGIAVVNSKTVNNHLVKDWTNTMLMVQVSFLSGVIGFYFGNKDQFKRK